MGKTEDIMKKLVLGVMIMGVLALQSCTMYRIKMVQHPDGATYYFPQKRILISDWNVIDNFEGDYTLKWARKVIEEDKNKQQIKINYIK